MNINVESIDVHNRTRLLREFQRADIDHTYTLKKFECAVIFGYIDPIDQEEFDKLNYDDDTERFTSFSGIWHQSFKQNGSPDEIKMEDRMSSNSVKSQIENLKPASWLKKNQDIVHQIEVATVASSSVVTKEIIGIYEIQKQEKKYKNWAKNNKEKSDRIDQIFNLYGSKPDYSLFRTLLIEKGVLSFDSKTSIMGKIWNYLRRCLHLDTRNDDYDIYDRIYGALKYGWIENDERRKVVFDKIGISDEETINNIQKVYNSIVSLRYSNWIMMLDFENDLETIISNAHASMHVILFPAVVLNLVLFGGYVFEMAYDTDTPTLSWPVTLAVWCFCLPLLCRKFYYAYRSLLKKRIVQDKQITFGAFLKEIAARTIADVKSIFSWNTFKKKKYNKTGKNTDSTENQSNDFIGMDTSTSTERGGNDNSGDRNNKKTHSKTVKSAEMIPIGNPLHNSV